MGSLFSGIGGFELGFERAGFTIGWQVENDPFCRRVLEKHWPHVPKWADVRDVHAGHLPPVDVITGGFPCQPFSSASRGRRRGLEDARYLWPDMRRIVADCRPAWVVVENVPHFDGPGLDQVVSDLEALAYDVGPVLEIPACAVGSDHWRPRLWICGHTHGHRQSGGPLDAEASRVPWGGDDPPGMGAADGLSRGVDRRRMKALGNAILPQIAQILAEAIRVAEAVGDLQSKLAG